MEQHTPIEEKKSFLRNDRKLVCSMFVIYGLCILGLVAATIWGLNSRSKTLSANATSTAVAAGTQQAEATTTAAAMAAAHSTAQAQYEVIDRFDFNRNGWLAGTRDNQYWSGYVSVQQGVYLWNVKDSKEGFVYWASFSEDQFIYDFDVYVDTKVAKGEPGKVCSGLIFRKASRVPEYYYFVLCNNAMVQISYHSAKDDWEHIATIPSFSSFSYSEEWNRLEVSVRGSHFTFFVNGSKIHEMDDERRRVGALALVVGVHEKTSARILFDNFGFQSR